VHLGEADVGEERLVGLGVASDEGGCPGGDLLLHPRPSLQIEVGHRSDRRPLHTLPDLGHGNTRLGEEGIGAVGGLIGSVLDAIPLIKALVGREPALFVADVPLAEGAGAIAGVGEQLAQGVLPGGEPVIALAGQGHAAVAGPDGQPSAQDGRAGRGALGLDVVVLEPHPLAGQGIDAWGGHHAAVAADVPPADVINQDEDHIGPIRTRLVVRASHERFPFHLVDVSVRRPAANLRGLCSPLSSFTGERASHTKGEPRQAGFLAARPAPLSRSSRWRRRGCQRPQCPPASSLAVATSTRPPPSAASGRITGSLPDPLDLPRLGRPRPSRPARRRPPARCEPNGTLVQTSTSRTQRP
jgi:hypothetical protein